MDLKMWEDDDISMENEDEQFVCKRENIKSEMGDSPPPDLGAEDEARRQYSMGFRSGYEVGKVEQAREVGVKPDLGAMLVELAERDGFEKGRQFWFMQDGMLVFVHSTNECKPNEPLAAVAKALEEGE